MCLVSSKNSTSFIRNRRVVIPPCGSFCFKGFIGLLIDQRTQRFGRSRAIATPSIMVDNRFICFLIIAH